ncbi:MAG: 1-phosphofructokinase [Methylobacterium frigidaeris]
MNPVVTLTLNPAVDLTVTLDRLEPGSVHRAREARADAGGKGLNVARCLADWGVPVAACGLLGRDNAGPFEAVLAQKGIADRLIRVAGETRTNLKLLDRASGDTTDVNLPGLAAGPADLAAVAATLADLAAPGSLAVLAGSLPAGLAPETYADLTATLKARGARVVLDASGPALAAALAAETLPDLVKPNRHELEEWAGARLASRAAVTEAARGLHRRGIALVVVSLGAEGALFVAGGEAWHAHPPAIPVASTVGAGDALVAGLVAGLHAGLPLPDTARLALAFAAGKLTRPGANLPDRAAVEALAASIRIEPVA